MNSGIKPTTDVLNIQLTACSQPIVKPPPKFRLTNSEQNIHKIVEDFFTYVQNVA